MGSAGQFDRGGRRAWSSVNFITSHDGFTLADVTRYNERHNAANGENGADGHHSNFSDNCGVEGDTTDTKIRNRRAQRQRNMLATLFLSQGTPMILAGDEFANSQGGNNNAYAQDNAIGWLNWGEADQELIEFVSRLAHFRSQHPCLHQTRFLHAATRKGDGLPDVEWTDFNGESLQWRDPGLSNLCLTLRMAASDPEATHNDDTVYIVFNRDDEDTEVKLPALPSGRHWVRAVDTAATDIFAVCEVDPRSMTVARNSVVAAVAMADETSR